MAMMIGRTIIIVKKGDQDGDGIENDAVCVKQMTEYHIDNLTMTTGMTLRVRMIKKSKINFHRKHGRAHIVLGNINTRAATHTPVNIRTITPKCCNTITIILTTVKIQNTNDD